MLVPDLCALLQGIMHYWKSHAGLVFAIWIEIKEVFWSNMTIQIRGQYPLVKVFDNFTPLPLFIADSSQHDCKRIQLIRISNLCIYFLNLLQFLLFNSIFCSMIKFTRKTKWYRQRSRSHREWAMVFYPQPTCYLEQIVVYKGQYMKMSCGRVTMGHSILRSLKIGVATFWVKSKEMLTANRGISDWQIVFLVCN